MAEMKPEHLAWLLGERKGLTEEQEREVRAQDLRSYAYNAAAADMGIEFNYYEEKGGPLRRWTVADWVRARDMVSAPTNEERIEYEALYAEARDAVRDEFGVDVE